MVTRFIKVFPFFSLFKHKRIFVSLRKANSMGQAKEKKEIYTYEEYLALDREEGTRLEFDQGRIILRDESTLRHNHISMNLAKLLNTHLPENYDTYTTSLKLEVKSGLKYTYPDVMSTCDPRDQMNGQEEQITFPYLIAEVTSKNTYVRDDSNKKDDYLQLSSMHYYMLLSQYKCYIQVYERQKGCWAFRFYDKPSQCIHLQYLDLQLPVNEIYKQVKLT